MFAKLLKHDTRAVFKYWWIGAVISMGLSVLGGFAWKVSSVRNTQYTAIQDLTTFLFAFCVLGVIMLSVYTYIILLVRYTKNFFSDEGYLTFTLPVKKVTLIDSKIAVAFIFNLASYAVMYLDFLIMDLFSADDLFSDLLGFAWEDFYKAFGAYTVPYLILFVLISAAFTLCSIALIYFCVTFACVVVKKAKVLVGIGLYQAFTWLVFSLVRVIVVSASFNAYDPSVEDLWSMFTLQTGLFVLLGILGILIVVFAAFYFVITVILSRKLNLA